MHEKWCANDIIVYSKYNENIFLQIKLFDNFYFQKIHCSVVSVVDFEQIKTG